MRDGQPPSHPFRPCSVSPTPAGKAARPTGVPQPGFKYRPTRKLAFVSPRPEIVSQPNPSRSSTLSPSEIGVRNSCSGSGNEPSRLREGGRGDARRRRGSTRKGGDAATSAPATERVQQEEYDDSSGWWFLPTTASTVTPPGGDPSRRRPLRRPLRWSSSRW
jgi:hypothetical protein